MKVIDSSSWINALRKSGDSKGRERVFQLLENGDAAWCDVIRLELWQGVVHPKESAFLKGLEQDIPCLAMTPGVWDLACKIAYNLRKTGRKYPLTDILVYACAHAHGLEIEHMDQHFEDLKRLDALDHFRLPI